MKAGKRKTMNELLTQVNGILWGYILIATLIACNLVAIIVLGKYAFRLLDDYRQQKRRGIKEPTFHRSQLPEIEKDVECWDLTLSIHIPMLHRAGYLVSIHTTCTGIKDILIDTSLTIHLRRLTTLYYPTLLQHINLFCIDNLSDIM